MKITRKIVGTALLLSGLAAISVATGSAASAYSYTPSYSYKPATSISGIKPSTPYSYKPATSISGIKPSYTYVIVVRR